MAEDTLDITCNFLYCNHQVHKDILISLYLVLLESLYLFYNLSKSIVLFSHIQGVSGGIVNILGGGSMDYSE